MATEIERKFLVRNDAWKKEVTAKAEYLQGYLSTERSCSIRVRVEKDKARLNIKSATLGVTRSEYDYPIPVSEANEILRELCIRPLLKKTRFHVPYGDHTWEIDVFEGDNRGLVVAEIELSEPDEAFARPDWLGEEVSDDPRYYNVCLIKHPYRDWHRDNSNN